MSKTLLAPPLCLVACCLFAVKCRADEFFSADGQWVWYDLQTPRADQLWLAGVHVKTGERVRYRLAREEWSVHYNISRDGKLFAGDGGGPESVANQTPLPEKKRLNPPGNGQWIYLFRPDDEFTEATVGGEPAKSGTFKSERLVDLSNHDYDLEPNVTFTPDGKWIVFRSNMHGERHVYEIARCVVEGIRSEVSELAKHLARDVKAFDPSAPDDPDRFDLPASPIIHTPRKPAGN